MTEFDMGVFYAAALLVTQAGSPTYAADVLDEAGLLEADISELDDTEKEAMVKLQEQDSRCKFTGL
ncbi:hypothetical protein [Enterovibrio paralichthyis]|uniref:hypothetical protein n=1 Tax=Enterovibrio paralichthyis TaxID=2853805 RepID=UPI001C460F46|nr:hypothetical protein [Enterovibrio paralichthyis]MBV7300233.1 hypothetical protein [Enterovibrio paralichthyis]